MRRAVIAVLCGGLLAGCGSAPPAPAPTHSRTYAAMHATDVTLPGQHASLITAVAPNGRLSPTGSQVLWDESTSVPGRPGHAVLVGTWPTLGQVQAGQHVNVTYSDHGNRTFRAVATQHVASGALRHRQDVWGPTSDPVLVLIAKPVHGSSVVVWAVPA